MHLKALPVHFKKMVLFIMLTYCFGDIRVGSFLFFIYLFVFPGLVTLSIPHTEKLHYCHNMTS